MTIIAARGATPIVQRFVLNLNTLLASCPVTPTEYAGTERRIAREKAEAKRMKAWHKSADKARAKLPVSRQVRRRMALNQRKSMARAVAREARKG